MEGLRAEDVRVLFLWMEPRRRLMVKEIAHELNGVSLPTLTRILDRLEERGFIKRMLNPEDRRRFRVAPTEQGQKAGESFLQQGPEVIQGGLEIVLTTELLALGKLMNKLQMDWTR